MSAGNWQYDSITCILTQCVHLYAANKKTKKKIGDMHCISWQYAFTLACHTYCHPLPLLHTIPTHILWSTGRILPPGAKLACCLCWMWSRWTKQKERSWERWKQHVGTSQGWFQKMPFALVQTKLRWLFAEENAAAHNRVGLQYHSVTIIMSVLSFKHHCYVPSAPTNMTASHT